MSLISWPKPTAPPLKFEEQQPSRQSLATPFDLIEVDQDDFYGQLNLAYGHQDKFPPQT